MSTNLQRGEFRVLGQDHPLTRATSRLSVAVEQCFTVSGLLAVGVYGLIDGLSIGLPLAVAAATVLIALLGRVGALNQSRKHRAVDLIADGRGSLPLEAVVRERRRLLDPSDRERMARTLDVIRAEVACPGAARHRVQPLYNVSVVRGVASELGELATLVREGGGLRGLARAEQLVTDGRSPLYGESEVVLHQELGRIRFLLASPDGKRSPEWGSLPIPSRPLRP